LEIGKPRNNAATLQISPTYLSNFQFSIFKIVS
jgi:hypothetical protein